MKKYVLLKILLCCAAIAGLLSGCQKQTDEEPLPEPTSQISVEASEREAIHTLIESYYSALATHDYEAMSAITSEEYIWNYDQTGFYDYCRRITAGSPISIEYDALTVEGERWMVPVVASLTYDAPHVDEDGVSRESGVYENKVVFLLTRKGSEYRIEEVRGAVMG